MDSFKRFGEEKLPDKECFYKDGTTDDNDKKLDASSSKCKFCCCVTHTKFS